ncbi:MAG: RIP metalloprotease RseP [Gammaproteobacteria bacterium]|nr:RIP metalloprotease RseP [Gammaproteobacteria bacterium]
MIDILLSIAAFIVAIGVLVSVHEFGHFWVARRLGFKVIRFSVGFGRPLLRWRGREPGEKASPLSARRLPASAEPEASDATEYWLSSIPLGGYVKLLDEREGPVPAEDRDRAFNRRPVWQRIAVLLAGPGFNFIFAIVAYWLMFVAGVPGTLAIVGTIDDESPAALAGLRVDDQILRVGDRDTPTLETAALAIVDELLADGVIDLTVRGANGGSRLVDIDVRGREAELTEPGALFNGLGFQPGPVLPAAVGELTSGGAAADAGFEVGDQVVRVDGQAMQSWSAWVDYVRARPDQAVAVTVVRDGREVDLPLVIEAVTDADGEIIGRAGMVVDLALAREIALGAQTTQRFGLFEALPRGVAKTWEISALTVRMLARMVVGDVSVRNLSGPINIAAYAGDSAQAGFGAFLSFLAVVSVSLGILNLLPIPLLDGGQILYQLMEVVKGSPLSERAMAFGQQIGVLFLIVLMSFAFYNDLSRIFG